MIVHNGSTTNPRLHRVLYPKAHKDNKNVASVLALSRGGVLPEVGSRVREAQKVGNEKPSSPAHDHALANLGHVSAACARELTSLDLTIHESRHRQH
jgi:hypothetical protein